MNHLLIKNFYQLWLSKRDEDSFPKVKDFSEAELADYNGADFVMSMRDGGLYYDKVSPRIQDVVMDDLSVSEIFDVYPAVLQDIHRELIRFIFREKVGLSRLARYWYGHRHKDAEWLLLPALNDRGELVMIGITVAFSAYDERDVISSDQSELERIVAQDYLSLGKRLDLKNLNGEAKSFLATMGTLISIDGVEHKVSNSVALGKVGDAAARAARPNVLMVSAVKEMAPYLSRLGRRYNLKIVETSFEAAEIMAVDRIDVLIASENIPDGTSGLDLIGKVQKSIPETNLILLLENRIGAEDQTMDMGLRSICCLVKPIGEFALRHAIDNAYKVSNLKVRKKLAS